MANKTFVILTLPRTGSYLLVDLLNQVPGLRCHGELFKARRLELDRDLRQHVKWTLSQRDERPIRYMRLILALGDYEASGFKLFPQHNRRVWRYVTSATHIHKVVLLRHPLSRYISIMRAGTSGRWVERKGDKRPSVSGVSFSFSPCHFKRFLRHHDAFVSNQAEAISLRPSEYTAIDYEDVVSLRALGKICEALGLPAVDPTKVSPSLQKQTKEPLSELVTNYEEMKTYLRVTHPTLLSQPGSPRLS
jgi:LPS sulfotransferase NodH